VADDKRASRLLPARRLDNGSTASYLVIGRPNYQKAPRDPAQALAPYHGQRVRHGHKAPGGRLAEAALSFPGLDQVPAG